MQFSFCSISYQNRKAASTGRQRARLSVCVCVFVCQCLLSVVKTAGNLASVQYNGDEAGSESVFVRNCLCVCVVDVC